MNQPDGFDCPGCAWPDPKHTSSFEFCENGAKAVTWEATVKRVDPAFFAQHTVTELYGWHDHDLENAGRLTEPLRYDAETDHFVPIGWDEAFQRIGTMMRAMDNPDRMEFYTSGRASNEAAFLYQLLGARLWHQQFPRLLEHVPRGDQRGPAQVDWRRQGHGDARGFRSCRRAVLHRPQSRHQPSAHADDPARGRAPGRCRSSSPIR